MPCAVMRCTGRFTTRAPLPPGSKMYEAGEEEEEEDEDEERAGDDESEDLYESDVSLAEDVDEQEEEAEPAAGDASASDQGAGGWVRAARQSWSQAGSRSRGARAQEAEAAGGGARGAPALRRGSEDEGEEEEEEEGEEASYDDEDEEFGDEDDEDDALLAAQGLRRRQEAGASPWRARCRRCAARLTTSGAQARSLHDNARCTRPPTTRHRLTWRRHASASARRVRRSLP